MIRYFSDEERERLLSAVQETDHPFLYTAVVASLSTGARCNEILGLKWKDVNLENGTITLFET